MSEQQAFGPTLRRLRIQRGVTINQIAAITKVSADLWMGLERNDFSRWPTGIYARAFLREYAMQIGVDPEATVDDFCRWFSKGDRRAERLVRDHAALVGHDLAWTEERAPGTGEERRVESPGPAAGGEPPLFCTRKGRVGAAVVDLVAIGVVAAVVRTLTPVGFVPALGLSAITYHAASLVALGCTPAMLALDEYVARKHPEVARPRARFIWAAERTER